VARRRNGICLRGKTWWPRMIAQIGMALMFVLTLASSASAECAWVVWEVNWSDETRTRYYTQAWQPRQGFTNAEACVKALVTLTEQEGKTALFRCFPDTVHPRGPKGSGR